MTKSPWEIYKIARRQKAAVFHLHDPELIPIGFLLRATGGCVVYDAHEDLTNDVLEKPWIPSKVRGIVSILVSGFERIACKCFSAVITADDKISRRLARTGKRLITLNNYPLASEFGSFGQSREQQSSSNSIVSFGGLYTFRAADKIVEAFSLLPEALSVRLMLGGGCESDLFREDLRAKPGWRRIEYMGPVNRPRMLSELSSALAAIVLFKKALNTQTVRSNRFYEALAAGIPVIAPNFGDWVSIVEKNQCGLTVDPEKPKEIADAIEWLLSHPKEALQMGRNGRELFLSEFNWEREAGKLVSLYGILTNSPLSTNI